MAATLNPFIHPRLQRDRSCSPIAGDYSIVFMIASLMVSFNIGTYFVRAALNDLKPVYKPTSIFRCVTPVVFPLAVPGGLAPTRFLGVAAWEFTGAAATRLALWKESQK